MQLIFVTTGGGVLIQAGVLSSSSENTNANPHTFVMKLSDKSSKIPNAAFRAKNTKELLQPKHHVWRTRTPTKTPGTPTKTPSVCQPKQYQVSRSITNIDYNCLDTLPLTHTQGPLQLQNSQIIP